MSDIVLYGTIIGTAFLLLIIVRMVRFPKQYEKLVILRLGKYVGNRGPGFTFVIPFLEHAYVTDMREHFLDVEPQTAITHDNASILIDFLVYYRITDPELAELQVDNVISATMNMATTTLRAVIGEIDLDSVLSQRERINETLRIKLDEATERWGVKVTSVEIREIEPPRDILDAMNRQMSAERQRRADVTRAQGERESAIEVAEGAKRASILKAEGEKEAVLLAAQAERESQRLKAEGYAEALNAIYKAAQHLDDKTMALQYMEMLEEIGKSESTKFVLPMELVSVVQQFSKTAGLGMMNNNGTGYQTPEQIGSGD